MFVQYWFGVLEHMVWFLPGRTSRDKIFHSNEIRVGLGRRTRPIVKTMTYMIFFKRPGVAGAVL